MECYKCSISGKKLVYMNICFDYELGAEIAICPICGHKEIVGFGLIR